MRPRVRAGYTLIEYALLVALVTIAAGTLLIPLTSALASVSKQAKQTIERKNTR